VGFRSIIEKNEKVSGTTGELERGTLDRLSSVLLLLAVIFLANLIEHCMSSAEPLTETSTLPTKQPVWGRSTCKTCTTLRLTRSVEDRVRRLYLQGNCRAPSTPALDRKAAVASAYALAPQDLAAPLIRDLGASFTRGLDPKRVFAQWLGRGWTDPGARWQSALW
jgi:hypothetical protein